MGLSSTSLTHPKVQAEFRNAQAVARRCGVGMMFNRQGEHYATVLYLARLRKFRVMRHTRNITVLMATAVRRVQKNST